MRIPENTIQQILLNTNIVDVIGQYVPLRAKGRNHWGVCPFHSEKTPSFSVSESKQIYHCFGCHNGGNVFKFLMEYKKISYVEAIVEVAQSLGITIQYEDNRDDGQSTEIEMMMELNEEVQKLFTSELFNQSAGKYALDYLTNRGLKTASLRSFGVGFAPPDRSFLQNLFRQNKDKFNRALALGLIGENQPGKFYDRFAGRIMFPVFSTNGRVVAFGGRIIEKAENTGKYVNSPESLIYTKGKVLYGLSHAKDDIRKAGFTIVVEGYMDLISLHQAGIKNVIAVSGTALTDDQAMLLSRYAQDVILLFDADEAGIKASMRSIEILLKRNMNIRIASLPNGEDPDSFLRSHTPEEFKLIISGAVDFLEFQTAFFERRGLLADPLKSASTIRSLLQPLTLLDDKLKQTMLLKNLSTKFNLRMSLLEDEIAAMKAKQNTAAQRNERARESSVPAREDQGIAETISKARKTAEQNLIKLLLDGEYEIVAYIHKHIGPDEFLSPEHHYIYELIIEMFDKEYEITAAAVADKISDNTTLTYVTELITEPYSTSSEWDKALPIAGKEIRLKSVVIDVVKNLKLLQIKERSDALTAELQREQSDERKLEIMHELNGFAAEKKNIEAKYRKYKPETQN